MFALKTSLIGPFSGELSYSNECGKFHEAGFDSYCTGVAFLKMIEFLNEDNTDSIMKSH